MAFISSGAPGQRAAEPSRGAGWPDAMVTLRLAAKLDGACKEGQAQAQFPGEGCNTRGRGETPKRFPTPKRSRMLGAGGLGLSIYLSGGMGAKKKKKSRLGC